MIYEERNKGKSIIDFPEDYTVFDYCFVMQDILQERDKVSVGFKGCYLQK